jgi:septin family protein
MKKISAKIPLIPVIAKSDTMTSDETTHFRREVMRKISENGVALYDWKVEGQEDAEITARRSETRPLPPFTIISAKDCISRRYAWGECRLDNDEHSDLQMLKALVMERHLVAMKEAAKQKWKILYLYYDVKEQKEEEEKKRLHALQEEQEKKNRQRELEQRELERAEQERRTRGCAIY